jgi:hypothetical protein
MSLALRQRDRIDIPLEVNGFHSRERLARRANHVPAQVRIEDSLYKNL